MNSYRFRFALFLIAASTLATWANAQNKPKIPCPSAQSMKAEQLYGLWAVRFTKPPAGLPERATLLLERHAEFSESLAGVISRDLGAAAGSKAIAGHAAKAELAGDLEAGMLLLDESSDSISITGTWNGEMVQGSCGKAFLGIWKDTSPSAPANAPDVPFTLTKLP
ncbi:hypothetical protein LP416_09815 [Polaromonas sp. P2-4]|nr:hypothetical protein LP416_09815 [Polaromonas sp. P2-4]